MKTLLSKEVQDHVRLRVSVAIFLLTGSSKQVGKILFLSQVDELPEDTQELFPVVVFTDRNLL